MINDKFIKIDINKNKYNIFIMNNNLYRKNFDNERLYLFSVSVINNVNMYNTTYSNDYKNYSKYIYNNYNQKESSIRLSSLPKRIVEYRNEILEKRLLKKSYNKVISSSKFIFSI